MLLTVFECKYPCCAIGCRFVEGILAYSIGLQQRNGLRMGWILVSAMDMDMVYSLYQTSLRNDPRTSVCITLLFALHDC
jgi:hypothetical protein